MGHLGLTPQSALQLGGHKVQGRLHEEAKQIETDALLLEKLGCFAVVLECIPAELARELSAKLDIPCIGIGAGPHVDGQVLVMHDMIGMQMSFKPKFLRRYAEVESVVLGAFNDFARDVREASFPSKEESYGP
jgi:3-methyl-2-oxobutanoate hydroxymethyltransferase